ncbi:MAG: hypothetical protein U1E36_01060 [Rickettsiales bacterium]
MANEPTRGPESSLSDEDKAELLRQYNETKTEQKAPVESMPEYGDVEALSKETKDEAIAIARDILEKLKLVYENIDLFELMTLAEDDILDDFAQDVSDLKTLFEFQVDQALLVDPTISHDPEVALASDALGMMSAVSRAHAKKKSKEINEEMLAFTVQQEIMRAQQQSPELKGKTVDKLAEDVERGLNKIQQKTRDAQRNMTPEDLDIRLERGLESRGVSPEQSQAQKQQQQQQSQQQQASQARQMSQALRSIQQAQPGQQASGQLQQQAKRASQSGQVLDVVRRRLQQLRNQPQQGQSGHQQTGQQQQQSARRSQQQAQQIQRLQSWQQQQQLLRRQIQRRQQLAQDLTRIRAVQKAATAFSQARMQAAKYRADHDDHDHDGHQDHHDDHHHDDHHQEAPLLKPSSFSLKKHGTKNDLSKMLAGADLSALKQNLSTVDPEKNVVGPRNAKDTIRDIQGKQTGQAPDDLPPVPPKKGPLVGM